METETSKKKYESRHRLTWAARYPLKPGRDVASRRGLLVLIADTAISGEYWVCLKRSWPSGWGLSVRGVRKILAKLCSEGVLRAQHRGFKQTTMYTLMRLGEVEQHGDFLPLGYAEVATQSTALAERNHSSSSIHPPI